ncbi:heparinase, partial [Thioclava sp. BHET1]
GEGHASTLAFELTSGRRPLIVNCGSGAPFGPDWRRAGRATPSHSTLAINGYSSSRFGGKGDRFADLAEVIHSRQSVGSEGTSLLVGHTGYSATHGLTHMRGLVLSQNGRSLTGEDTLASLSDAERGRFDALLQQEGRDGVEFVLRFHLH